MENKEILIREFGKGEVIFREGDYASCMYDILRGRVGIYTNYGTAEEKLLTELELGRFFGEMGMIESYPRSATAVAMEDGTRVRVITAETFGIFFRENPEKVMMIMRNMSHRIRELTKDYLGACRAVVEAAGTAETGREKSGWFKEHFKKFSADFEEAARAADRYTGTNFSSPTWYW